MIIKKFKNFSLCLLLLVLPVTSLGQQYNFINYSTEEGLPQSQVHSIYQDSSGYLWIGTLGGGVSRFNGRTFTNFTTKEGLSDNHVLTIAPGKFLMGTETVLLVDDEAMVSGIGKRLLEKLGYTVLVAGGGKEAIEMYDKNKDKIALVILDMIMPGMGGGEAFDRLKKINPGIKVLLSSGYSMNGQAGQIMARGCKGFIQKPFNLKDLSKKVRMILDN